MMQYVRAAAAAAAAAQDSVASVHINGTFD